jgi:hypothetical protein
MDIATAALIAEIIGAIAVVISLIYLAMQIRGQNTEARIAAMHDISVGYRDSLSNFADEQTAILFDKAIQDYHSLTHAESIRLIAILGRIFRVWEEAFIQHQAGRLEERMWQSMFSQFHGYMSVLPFEKVWELRRDYFDPEFAEFVDSLEKTSYRFQ